MDKRFSIPQKPLSFSSLRVDSLTPLLADPVFASGQKTITLAPEAGSERMRRVVRKGFTEAEILGAAEILADRGVNNLRLYFIIGLPCENLEDVQAIVDLTKKIRHHLPDFYVYRQRPFQEILLWAFIDHGIRKEFLWAEYQEALKEGFKDSRDPGAE